MNNANNKSIKVLIIEKIITLMIASLEYIDTVYESKYHLLNIIKRLLYHVKNIY